MANIFKDIVKNWETTGIGPLSDTIDAQSVKFDVDSISLEFVDDRGISTDIWHITSMLIENEAAIGRQFAGKEPMRILNTNSDPQTISEVTLYLITVLDKLKPSHILKN